MEAKYFGKVNRVDVANKTNFRPKCTFRYFTNTQNCQYFHYCQLCISIYIGSFVLYLHRVMLIKLSGHKRFIFQCCIPIDLLDFYWHI